MNIAQQIKAFYTETNDSTGASFIADYDAFSAECEEKAVSIDQDYDYESTTFEFADGSLIVWSGNNVSAYGAK